MMELLAQTIKNPLFLFLFGSGGILAVVIAIITLKSKKKNSDNKGINIGININNGGNQDSKRPDESPEYILEIDGIPQVDKFEEYQQLDFGSDDFYVTFLKTIEEKKKARDDINYE